MSVTCGYNGKRQELTCINCTCKYAQPVMSEIFQDFEKYELLTDHIKRMAFSGSTGNTIEWDNFLRELNSVLEDNQKRIEFLENELIIYINICDK